MTSTQREKVELARREALDLHGRTNYVVAKKIVDLLDEALAEVEPSRPRCGRVDHNGTCGKELVFTVTPGYEDNEWHSECPEHGWVHPSQARET